MPFSRAPRKKDFEWSVGGAEDLGEAAADVERGRRYGERGPGRELFWGSHGEKTLLGKWKNCLWPPVLEFSTGSRPMVT